MFLLNTIISLRPLRPFMFLTVCLVVIRILVLNVGGKPYKCKPINRDTNICIFLNKIECFNENGSNISKHSKKFFNFVEVFVK